MKLRAVFVTLVAALLAVAAQAADPVVSNVTPAQRTDGSGIVEVTYDLADADGDTCFIGLQASTDGGATWILPCPSLGGDAGAGIAPGTGRVLTWNIGRDHPGYAASDLRLRVTASDLGVDHAAHSPLRYAALHWGDHDWTDDAMIEEIARADLLCIDAEVLWSDPPPSGPSVVERIKAINPDCTVIGYVSVQMIRLDWEGYAAGTYARTRWEALRPYWASTTTGDTLQSWPGKVNVNILEPACRDTIVAIIADYQQNSGTAFDGVFWDYFNAGIWIPNFVNVTGDPDLDGDGIGIMSDPGELAAYKAACEDMVAGLRARLGEGFLQIFNGQRAYTDSTFAALCDGMNYELFPTLGFQAPDKMRKAMDPAVYNSLWHARRWPRTVNGGPYLLLENINRAFYFDDQQVLTTLNPGDSFRAVSLLIDGCYPVWDDFGEHLFGWPDVVHSLGAPLGPTAIQGNIFTRNYAHGDVRLEMVSGVWPNPFTYRIRLNGRVVEELALPYHTP
ncbi:MAG: hypothetical protein IPH09_15450 [bacterium]|nr:hypothetical protein [bacterium]